MPSVDTGAPPKWPPALSGLADTFGHHSCCLKVSPAPGSCTHIRASIMLQLGLSVSHTGVQPCMQAHPQKVCQAASGKQMPPTEGTLLERLTLVTKGDHVTGTSHATQSHSLKIRRLVYPICRKKHKVRQSEETKDYVPNKIRRQTLRNRLNEMEISNLPDKLFKVMVIKTTHWTQWNRKVRISTEIENIFLKNQNWRIQ